MTAASSWGGIAERRRPCAPRCRGIEELLHETGKPAFFLPMHDGSRRAPPRWVVRLGHRAIG